MFKRTTVQLMFKLIITSVMISMCISCNNTSNNKTASEGKPTVFSDQNVYTDPSSGTTWVPLESVVQSLGLRMHDSENSVQFGYTDPMYEVYPGQLQALALGSSTTLQEAPTRRNGKSYMTLRSLSHLLQTSVYWNQPEHRIEISSLQDAGTPPSNQIQMKSLRATSTTVDTDKLISYAKKYLGVPYEFGAQPYAQSKTFDCSSFTQHVFSKFNRDLPRLARSQGNEGMEVSRNNLNPGDLIFFTVEGRFKSDAIPGHVGIYIGDGKFIHTWGEPGVQISNLDTGYWSDVILFMRSIL
ncbi:C40 family peptidase [Paenibacillus crassostreae]|uniref:NlpC/P60 domain-containing protein n=1 Tax=Paenibacillus crassostreae TaxID=1763538 RepID=A0A167B7M4_9BACL|nr:C40 family peptidase [Paenibacillus crassostreae]AOZ93103.1 hypothetical protein LPB68_13370 [Paenibacillus crassostreae]OAB71808.1 hypothetical protein PNBC_17520 [Paenibacillus crassostreae]